MVTQVTALGVSLGWLEAGYRFSCKIAATPPCADAAVGVTWQTQGQKYPVRALHRSLPATSKVALLLHHEPFRSSSSDLPMSGACALVYLFFFLNDCSAILFHLLVIARLFFFPPPSLFFDLLHLFSLLPPYYFVILLS